MSNEKLSNETENPELNKDAVMPSAIFHPSGKRKAVIKLDKNFHLYIHGDSSKIEEGVDDSGKFIKIYYVHAD